MRHKHLSYPYRTLGVALAGALLATLAWPVMAVDFNAAAGSGVLVPVVAILSVFGVPAVAVVLVAYFVIRHRERRAQLLNERIQRFLEAGQPIPENLMQDGGNRTTPEQHQQQGLLLLGLGIGLMVFLTLVASLPVGSLGLVFIGVGVAKLIIWKMAARQG